MKQRSAHAPAGTAYVDLQPSHVDAAAKLVCARLAALHAERPHSVAPDDCDERIRAQLRQLSHDVPCVVALDQGRVTGFLGAFLTDFRGIPTAYVPDWGHAAAGDAYHVYRGMYANLAQRWLDNGCFQQAITLFAHERVAMEAWISLGFGAVVIDAVRAPAATRPATDQLEIHRAGPADLETVLRLEIELWRHLSRAPVFIPFLFERSRDAWTARLAQDDAPVWLARHAGDPVAFFSMTPPEHAVLPVAAPDTIAIDGAFTQPAARAHGIAGHLLDTGLAWARAQGYARVSVDFESANVEASHFWLGHGFDPVCYSFMRRVDSRLAWANAARHPADIARAYQLGRAPQMDTDQHG